jgi:hypothetical protein
MSHREFALTLLFAAAVLVAAHPARAAVSMFVDATPDSTCTNTGAIVIGNTSAPIVLDLCVAIGSAHSSNPCRTGSTGDDICAYHTGIQLNGTGFVANFQPTSGVRYWPQTFTTTTRTMKFAYVGAYSQPSSAGPVKIGTLTVNATPAGGTRVLTTGFQVVDSGLQTRLVPSGTTIATLPEPGVFAQLATGALVIALLHSRNRRHER